MTFEKKTLVLMSILGPLETTDVPFLSTNMRMFPVGHHRHIILFGSIARQENDAESAFKHALELQSKDRKIIISTESVLFENQLPQILWLDSWNQTFGFLQNGNVCVSLDLVRIYQRIFEIKPVKANDGVIFLLKQKKMNPSRIRGIQRKYTPLVGRKKELSTLLEVIEQSFEDQGQIASIIGDAGLGKTRLVHELKEDLVKKNIRFYEGFFSLNSDLNFRGFHQLVQQIMEKNADLIAKWKLTDSDLAFLRYFLHPEKHTAIVKDLNEEEVNQRVSRGIQALFANAGQEPMVLLLDDFHWAGSTSIQNMDHLAQSLEKTKIAFFLVHRPTYVPSFQRRLNYHQIKLLPLKHEETKELVKNTLHLNFVTEGAIETLTNLSLGNPLYVEEILRELINQKKLNLQKSDDVLRLLQVQFPEGVIPTNIYSLITARLDLLSTDARSILQWICVFGFRENQADFELFLQTLGLPIETFETLFDQHYLEEASMFPEHKYKFQHDLLYETVKQSITTDDWTEKNQVIAEFLTKLYHAEMIIHGDRIAEFYMKGHMNADSFTPIFQAACIALEQKRYKSSIRYFEACNNLFSAHQTNIDPSTLYKPYLEAIFATGTKEKIQTIVQDWERAGFSTQESEISYYKYYLEYLFNYRETEPLMETSEKALNKFSNLSIEDAFDFKTRHFQAHVFKFDFANAVHMALKLLREANSLPSLKEKKIDILYSLGFITQQEGHPNIGSYLTLIAKEITDNAGNLRQKSMIYMRIVYLAVAQGLYKEAARVLNNLEHLAKQGNFPIDQFRIDIYGILNFYFLGHYEKALEISKKLDRGKTDWDQMWSLNWIGQTYLAMGRFDETRKFIANHRFFPTRDPYIRCNLLYIVGNYHFQRGEYAKARKFYNYAKILYQKKDQKIYAYQMQLFELRCRVLLKKTSTDDATNEFDSILSHEGMRKYFYEWNAQMMSYWFARHGCNIRFKPSEDFDPIKCNAVYLRMQMFVEKIKWLEYIGELEKARIIKEQYLAHRKEMAFYVPNEFKNSYLEHPFYQV